MKYSSNHVVKLLEYEFEMVVSKATLRTKFPCQLYTSLKYRSDLPELLSSEVIAQNGEVFFNHTHRFTMLFKSKDDILEPQPIILSVGVRSKHRPLEKIVAGFVTLDLVNYTKHSQPLKTFRIQRCPDPESVIELAIKSNKIREVFESEPDLKASKNKFYKSQQSLLKLSMKQKFEPKRSIIINKSMINLESFQQNVNISGSFSKFLNGKFKQQGSLCRLLTPDKQQNCQLSFAKLKDSVISKSLNYQEEKKSVEVFPIEFDASSKEIQSTSLQQINDHLSRQLEKTQKENAKQQAYIELLEQQLRGSKERIENQKSTMLSQTVINQTILQKQLVSQNSGSTIQTQISQRSIGDIELIQRNQQLLKVLGQLRESLIEPITELQSILHNQTQQYQEESSWAALNVLSTITEKLNIS